jgi:hypothetical protein
MNALETQVLELIGESVESPDVFTDDAEGMAPIRDSLNDAIQEVVMLTGGVKRTYLIPLRQEVGIYRIRPASGHVGWITDAWLVNSGCRLAQTDLIRLAAHNPRWMTPTGSPEAYFPIGQDVVGFYPKPSGNSDVVELTLVEIPAAYSEDTDRIAVRNQFQYALVHYAVAEFWASRGDAAEAQVHFALYLQALGLRSDWNAIRDPRGFRTQKEPWPVAAG